jgi:hypothetical protein
MEQSRKSSEREKVALQQAQEAVTLKEVAVAEAAQATSRENYMLELMTDASLDMAGMLHNLEIPLYVTCFSSLTIILPLSRFLFRCCCRRSMG